MTLRELKKNLNNVSELKNINSWKFDVMQGGIIARHKYKISKGDKQYFVKDIKENEKNILKVLVDIDAKFIPKIYFPQLLNKNILVTEYLSGGQLIGKKLDKELLIGFVKFQNFLNDKVYLTRNRPGDLANFSEKDGGFFKKCITANFNFGLRYLSSLNKFNLETVELNMELLSHLRKHRKEIIRDFTSMPFARQHHDFKEDNIIGNPQKLTDWGSSYGYGPFLFDLAPFLLNDNDNYELFIENSDICTKYDRKTIDRWLYVAAVARFVENLRYRLKDNGLLDDREKCKEYLEYEYQTYKHLYEFIKHKT